jgi:hypothetical protein
MIALAIILAHTLAAQTQTLGSVEGTVTNSVTGQPIKRASVSLRTSSGVNAYNASTDATGKFHFDAVAPGKYLAVADAEGYASNIHTSRTQKPVAVAEKQGVTGIAIEAVPFGVIAGRVTDDANQPVQGIMVMALAANGRRRLPGGTAITDDRGRYRMIDVQSGRYYIRASPPPNNGRAPLPAGDNVHRLIREESYPQTYYPGVTDVSQASAESLKPGGELAADFHLRKLPLYHIRGRLAGAGRRTPDLAVEAEPCAEASSMALSEVAAPVLDRYELGTTFIMFSQGTAVNANGSFEIPALISGEYCLSILAAGRRSAGPRVTVKDASVDGVELTAPDAFALHGTVTVDGPFLAEAPPFSVGLAALDSVFTSQETVENGAFQTQDIVPGPYRLWLSPGSPVYVKSIRYGSQEIADGIIPMAQAGVPLNIKLGTDPGELSVAVSLGDLAPGLPLAVAAIPEAPLAARSDLQRFGTPDANGNVSWSGMAPGIYKIIAFESGDSEDMADLALLKLLDARSVAVTIHPGGHESAVVPVISAADIDKAKDKLR